jgi:hypothetical protein
MGLVVTRVLREDWEIEPRLAELSLDKRKLLLVRLKAISAAADATPFHAANASGTFSYHCGTFALRDEFVGDVWKLDRLEGVEAICNDEIKVKIIFANVDIAHDYEHDPKPRSRKGAGSERMCSGNLFPDLPRYAPAPAKGWSIYYLMVDEHGAAELSCTVVRNGTFAPPVERIFLSDGSDIDGEAKLPLDDKDAANDFDPKVARK